MAKRKKRPENVLGVRELVDAARRNTKPRKHHLVPKVYLTRSSVEGRIQVTETDTKSSFVTAAAKAARQTDFYLMGYKGLSEDDVPPMLFEALLSKVESDAIAGVDGASGG